MAIRLFRPQMKRFNLAKYPTTYRREMTLDKHSSAPRGAMSRLSMYWLLAAMLLALAGNIRSANSQAASASDEYTTRIQPIFNNRCIACHSCYNAPCQLNLQSYSGLARGATKLNVYDRSRLESVAPSRLGIDARNV